MRHIRLFAASFVVVACTAVQGQDRDQRPNVLFIFVDDLRPETGAYGNKVIQTPNLDKLSRNARVFMNHYVQVPTCGASRFSLLTGRLPRTPALLRNDAFEKMISDKAEEAIPETFIHHLRRNGYFTVGIGKVSHSADGLVYPYTGDPENAKRELPHSWDELMFNAGKWRTGWNAFFGYADGTNRQGMDRKVRPYEAAVAGDTAYVDGLTASLAVEKLAELADDDRPFFLGVGFFKPHLPFTAPKKYWDLYNESTLPLTPSPRLPLNTNAASFHNSNEFNSYQSGEEHPSLTNPVSDSYSRKLTHAYYAAVSYVDAQIGRVLQALASNGLDRNTIVVVWGDHGWQLGDYRVWGKHTLAEKALRSPLIIKVPGARVGMRPSKQIVSSVDIYPTLMELCNMSMPYSADGKSFAKLFQRSKIKSWDNVAYGYFNQGITIRSDRYRLTHYFRAEEPVIELYDHKDDPHENKNVAEANPNETSRLLELLEKGDTGLFNSLKDRH